MNLNQDEKNKLSQLIKEEMARTKADELGVDTTDMMQRVFDGRSSWVKKSTVYIQLDKQRKLVAPQKVMRSLRGGQDSLLSRIHVEIANCRGLINEIAKQSSSDREFAEIKSSVHKLENRANSLSSQLADVETKIDRMKSRDPIFSQAEAVLTQVRVEREKDGDADKLLLENKELLSQYEFLRKSLLPYLEEARKCRLELQKEYWLIMQNHYKLSNISIQQIKQSLAHLIPQWQKKEGQSDQLLKASDLLRNDEEISRTYRDLYSHTPPSHLPQQDASKIWDCILPEMENLIHQDDALRHEFSDLLGQNTEKEQSLTPRQRMAFVQQKKR